MLISDSGLCQAYASVGPQEAFNREPGPQPPLGEGCGCQERTHAWDPQQDQGVQRYT